MRPSVCLLLILAACSPAPELGPTPTTTTSVATGTTIATTTTPAAPSTSAASSTTTTTLATLQSLAYQEVAQLPFPIQITALAGSPNSYVITKEGQVLLYDGTTINSAPVLDISDQVRNQGEQGLLSIALGGPPGADPERMWLHYSDGNGDTVVSEFSFIDAVSADPASERVLFTLDQPASNHNGGMLFLAPDGNLYLGLGDGGGANDQFGHGQDRDTFFAGIVRLSPTGEPSPTLFQYGLRNPWRFWIDGDLIYIADVGQNAYEEVSVSPLVADVNYGWSITEGLHCFSPSSGCDTSGLTLPVIEVAHGDAGTCSITGGVVYRGQAIPEVTGHYFYSDLCGGYLRSFRYDGGVTDQTDWTDQVGVPGRVVSFGVDGFGEIYVATTEALLKLVPVR